MVLAEFGVSWFSLASPAVQRRELALLPHLRVSSRYLVLLGCKKLFVPLGTKPKPLRFRSCIEIRVRNIVSKLPSTVGTCGTLRRTYIQTVRVNCLWKPLFRLVQHPKTPLNRESIVVLQYIIWPRPATYLGPDVEQEVGIWTKRRT